MLYLIPVCHCFAGLKIVQLKDINLKLQKMQFYFISNQGSFLAVVTKPKKILKAQKVYLIIYLFFAGGGELSPTSPES